MNDFTTFGKSEVVDTDGSTEITIFWAGEEVGYIYKEMVEVGATSIEYRTAHYTVEIFTEDDIVEETFGVEGFSTTARQSLANARAFARDTLKTLDREGA